MELNIPTPEQAYWKLRAMKTVALCGEWIQRCRYFGSCRRVGRPVSSPPSAMNKVRWARRYFLYSNAHLDWNYSNVLAGTVVAMYRG